MKKYKGYYIDHVYFNSESDIDAFIKKQAIERYKTLAVMFSNKPSMELTSMMCDLADRLVKVFGLTYTEIEELEIAAIS